MRVYSKTVYIANACRQLLKVEVQIEYKQTSFIKDIDKLFSCLHIL